MTSLTFPSPSLQLSYTHALSCLKRVLAAKPMVTRVFRLGDLLQVLYAVVCSVFVDVVNDVTRHHGILRVVRVPHVLVALYVPVLSQCRVGMPLRIGDSNEHPSFVTDPRPVNPVGVVLCTSRQRDLFTHLWGHAPRGFVSAGSGTVADYFVTSVGPGKYLATYGT